MQSLSSLQRNRGSVHPSVPSFDHPRPSHSDPPDPTCAFVCGGVVQFKLSSNPSSPSEPNPQSIQLVSQPRIVKRKAHELPPREVEPKELTVVRKQTTTTLDEALQSLIQPQQTQTEVGMMKAVVSKTFPCACGVRDSRVPVWMDVDG